MSLLDYFFETKVSSILAMVTKLTSWSLGLDKRMAKIERRLGSIEMAMTAKGVSFDSTDDEEKGG